MAKTDVSREVPSCAAGPQRHLPVRVATALFLAGLAAGAPLALVDRGAPARIAPARLSATRPSEPRAPHFAPFRAQTDPAALVSEVVGDQLSSNWSGLYSVTEPTLQPTGGAAAYAAEMAQGETTEVLLSEVAVGSPTQSTDGSGDPTHSQPVEVTETVGNGSPFSTSGVVTLVELGGTWWWDPAPPQLPAQPVGSTGAPARPKAQPSGNPARGRVAGTSNVAGKRSR